MARKVICGILFLFIFISLVGATSTEIDIKTIPNHEVQVAVADGTIIDFSVIQRFKKTSDEYGDVSFELVSDKPKINLYVYVKKDNENVINEKYMGYPTGEPISIELAPNWFDFIDTPTGDEEVENETINEEEIEEAESGATTGLTVFGEGGILANKTIYYIVGAVFLIGVVAFFIVRKGKIGGGEIKVKKLSELKKESDVNNGAIEEAERKIREAQAEINKLKNEDKISAAEKKLKEDQEALERLKRGE